VIIVKRGQLALLVYLQHSRPWQANDVDVGDIGNHKYLGLAPTRLPGVLAGIKKAKTFDEVVDDSPLK